MAGFVRHTPPWTATSHRRGSFTPHTPFRAPGFQAADHAVRTQGIRVRQPRPDIVAFHSNKPGTEIQLQRELRLLEALHGDERITQRRLSTKLGIALGLTNLYLKRLVRKGYVKCVTVPRNRMRYLVTPRGIAEKTRLTYKFMEQSLRFYRETRQHLRTAIEEVVRDGCTNIAIYGTGEPAELAYISLKELGLEPVAVFDGKAGASFLGMPVRPLSEHTSVDYDLMIVASLGQPGPRVTRLLQAGVPEAKLCTLRPLVGRSTRKAIGGAAQRLRTGVDSDMTARPSANGAEQRSATRLRPPYRSVLKRYV